MSCGALTIQVNSRAPALLQPVLAPALVPGSARGVSVSAQTKAMQITRCSPGVSISASQLRVGISQPVQQLAVTERPTSLHLSQAQVQLKVGCTPAATMPGLSAYQIAVLHGFVGTETEWLTSLVGPPGAPGGAGVSSINGMTGDVVIYPDLNYTHIQNLASTSWLISHNLGKIPSVTVFDSGGTEQEVEVVSATSTTVQIALAYAISGKAYLN